MLFNNAGISAAAVPLEELPLATWNAVVATNLTGPFLCTQGGLPNQEGSGSARRTHHQQWVNLRACPAPALRGLYRYQARHDQGSPNPTSLDGRDYDIACGQIDIGNARTELADKLARASATPEPLMDVEYVAQAVLNMARLPLSANVQFMTIMATKMPYIGRG